MRQMHHVATTWLHENQRNIKGRDLSFDQAAELDWDNAWIYEDERNDYGEVRYAACSMLGKRLHFVCFGERGAQKTPTKVPISIRISPEVAESFRAEGRGWQVHIDRVLKDYVAQHK